MAMGSARALDIEVLTFLCGISMIASGAVDFGFRFSINFRILQLDRMCTYFLQAFLSAP